MASGGRSQNGTSTATFSALLSSPDDCVQALHSGGNLIKVKSSRRHYHRRFSLNEEATYLSWSSKKKNSQESRISITSVKEIRRGQNTETFQKHGKAFDADRSFSVIYSDDYLSLDLVANSQDEASVWIEGLMCVMDENYGQDSVEKKQKTRDRWLKATFEEADKSGDGMLEESEVINLCQKLNVGLPVSKLKQKFREHDTDRSEDSKGKLDLNEFAALFKELSTRPEIYHLLMRYSSSRDILTPQELKYFLELEQGMRTVSLQQCKEWIQMYEPTPEGREKFLLSIDGFTQMLLGRESALLNLAHRSLYQDMTLPLSHYYIASSHNTYLAEDQLRGPSDVEMYIRALRRGCRCVELDCWDGSHNEPEVYHGHTLTSHIRFKDIIVAIKEHAFETSEYPVILSLENHCSIPMQKVMASHLQEILGDMLYTTPPDETRQYLPSPEELKGKILVKGKKLKPEFENEDENADEGDVSDEDEAADLDDDVKVRSQSVSRTASPNGTDQADGHRRRSETRKQKSIKLAVSLSKLVTYVQSVHFRNFQESAENAKYYHMSSFTEGSMGKLASGSSAEYVNYNKRQLSRIYPAGTRVNSSNYNPQVAWNVGCQIVALNYQTDCEEMDLNQGRFQINGKSGYVLKPEILRTEVSHVDVNGKHPIPGVLPQLMTIKVISGQQVPKPPGSGAKGEVIDPFVSVQVFGIPSDSTSTRTSTVKNNGFNPTWDSTFKFLLKFPDVAMVRFSVLDDDFVGDDFIGQYSVPVPSIQPGYRHIPLYSKSGEVLKNSTVFVHVSFEPSYTLQKRNIFELSSGPRSRRRNATPKKVKAPDINAIFQNVAEVLQSVVELDLQIEKATREFKAVCGSYDKANILQAIKLFVTRVKAAQAQVTFKKTKDTLTVTYEKNESFPDSIEKMTISLNQLLDAAEAVVTQADAIIGQLMGAYNGGQEIFIDLDGHLTRARLKGRKLSQNREYFAWNMQVVRSHAELLRTLKDRVVYMNRQIEDVANDQDMPVRYEI
ncbi:inactive phospholipase C-like protein 2 isoform X2 [Corticium candelabrum]|uniref:inactive phospholipase C-like protein 2 isoform X2 n=1 Tax=Corticium candelabrum TaxID=121492 RepID=UPI002E2584CE|nr:inactive phospholipase C-like protein 2 isoform X2 [Corticium candelabrum]